MTVAPAGQHTVRQHNRSLVLQRVAASPGHSRAQIAQATGLTRATVSALVDELLAAGLVVEMRPGPVSRGRPASPLRLNPQGPAGLGIEINVDYTAACVVDLTGAVRARRTRPVDNSAVTPQAGLRRAARLAAAVTAEAGVETAGIALAVPGLVDAAGVLRRTPNLPRWPGAAAADLIGHMLNEPVVAVENEANLAALAEHWYGGAPADFLHVSGEIGVGGGLILGGELFRGVRGYAGELGHVSVDPAGPRCACGGRGCLEQLAGQAALLRAAGVGGECELREAAAHGNRRALVAIEDTARALSIALAAAVNVVDVPVVILGGFYARLGEWLVAPISAQLAGRVVSGAPVEVRVSALGVEAAMLGAAGSVVRRIIADAGALHPAQVVEQAGDNANQQPRQRIGVT